jgi:arylformamidase
MKEFTYKITDPVGIHARPAGMLAKKAAELDSTVTIIKDGKSVDAMELLKMVGYAYVVAHDGIVTAEDARAILQAAHNLSSDSAKRILIKGKATVSYEAANAFAESGIYLIGNESQTVGPEDGPMAVHQLLLGQEIVLLEGIRLGDVPEGVYFLFAAPINLGGVEGSPCRAILIDFM